MNSELTVDLQFTALVNNQNMHCAAHISASMPPGSNGSPTLVPAGSTLTCTASTAGGGNGPLPSPVLPTGYPNNPGFGTPGYGVPQFPSAMLPQPQLYNTVPPYLVSQGPQLVYRTKFVPISVPTLVRPPPVPVQSPMPLPSNPYVIPGGPMRVPLYGASLGISPYNGLPVNDVITPVNYVYWRSIEWCGLLQEKKGNKLCYEELCVLSSLRKLSVRSIRYRHKKKKSMTIDIEACEYLKETQLSLTK